MKSPVNEPSPANSEVQTASRSSSRNNARRPNRVRPNRKNSTAKSPVNESPADSAVQTAPVSPSSSRNNLPA